MTPDDMAQHIMRLRAQHQVLRDFVIWMIAREASGSQHPAEEVMRLISEFSDGKIDGLSPQTDDGLVVAEMFRREKDLIVHGAVSLLQSGQNNPGPP